MCIRDSLLAASLFAAVPARAAPPKSAALSAVPAKKRTWKSVLGLVLGSAGTIAVGTGVARLLQSADYDYRERQYLLERGLRDGEDLDYDWLRSQRAAAKTQGLLLLSLGGAALVGGMLLFWLDTPADVTLGMGFAPGTVSFALTTRW